MNPARIWVLGSVVAIVAIVGGAVGLGVQPQLAAASAADASTTAAQAQTATTQIQLAALSKAAASQSKLEATDTKLSSAITGSLRLSTFSSQVRAIAALDGVSLTSLSPGVATNYAPAVAAPASGASSSTTSTTSGSKPVSSGVFGKTDPLITAANFTVVPMTVVATGDDTAGVQFASDLQHMDRLFAVNTVTYSSAADSGTLPSTTVSGDIYVLQR